MVLLEQKSKDLWVEQRIARSRESREPEFRLSRMGAEPERMGAQLLPWVITGQVVRVQLGPWGAAEWR